MSSHKGIYSFVVILFTLASVGAMIYFRNSGGSAELDYTSPYLSYEDEENDKYLGYIFDDYNRTVNLSYRDKAPEKPVTDGSVSTFLRPDSSAETNTDTLRMLRSESIIDERARQDK